MKLAEPPHYSQHLDFTDNKRNLSGCGVVSLKMLMELWRVNGKHARDNIPSLDKLYEVGFNRRSYIEGVGWRHAGLVGIAKLYGFKHSKSFDFAQEEPAKALNILKQQIKKYPVMVSVYSRYEPGNGGHLAILFSLDNKRAVLLDPDAKERGGIRKEIPAKKFIQAWKQRFIIVKP